MGMRGPGAKPRSRHSQTSESDLDPLPWETPGLSRPERVIAFIEYLPVTQGVGAGKRNLVMRPWQREFIQAIYGPEDGEGRRLVRKALFTCGRKNGKTEWAAALALVHLIGPEAEERGEVYSFGADKRAVTVSRPARIFYHRRSR